MTDEDLIALHRNLTTTLKRLALSPPQALRDEATRVFSRMTRFPLSPQRLICVIIQAELDFLIRPHLPQGLRSKVDGEEPVPPAGPKDDPDNDPDF